MQIFIPVTKLDEIFTLQQKGKLSPVLQSITQTVIDKESCRIKYDYDDLHENSFCLDVIKDKHAWNGDSGSPVIDFERRLVGLVSWGNDPHPDVNTNVIDYHDWIRTKTNLSEIFEERTF